ncbi:hypothetical protein IQ258_25575 [Coleofasciculus sp. LEGE 07081]|nr:hypothetical protein [Coleofasciculus sp. LEGE 07081]MBE9129428.1 hypothetical protein [Coleofasciculus sp. LEGE 07081]
MKTPQSQSTRVDTLIITVGTRQVGWRCNDGAIRSFGADANISYPPHVAELYQELGIERGAYLENGKTYPWSARDLGQRYYNWCVERNDFSLVELLLDQNVIESGVKQGLKHIILWGTDQPETVSWFYRRLDTLWLAQLMAGKIRAIWSDIRVDIHTPVIAANDSDAIRKELELLILHEALNAFSPSTEEEFVLWIQNKGCAPSIASGVEICAAALVRQCQVFNAMPEEPDSFFDTLPNGTRTACHSPRFKLIPMGEYFLPLERMRIISAWERGDFSEAQLWLKVHQSRYKILYKLAGILALYTHWETDKFLQRIGDWLRSNDLAAVADTEQIGVWKDQWQQMKASRLIQAWESSFLIKLPLLRQNYTAAFVQFAQTLERLLYIQCQNNDWVSQGFVTPPPHLTYLGKDYLPGLGGLIEGWRKSQGITINNKEYQLLDRIRNQRNGMIHSAQPISLGQIRSLWSDGGLFAVKHSDDPEVVNQLMLEVLNQVSSAPDRGNLFVR